MGKRLLRPISARYVHGKEIEIDERQQGKSAHAVPRFDTDEEAERFVAEADLTKYDFSEMVPMRFEVERKSDQVNTRVPKPLLDAVKARARRRGIPYTRFIRELMEREILRPER